MARRVFVDEPVATDEVVPASDTALVVSNVLTAVYAAVVSIIALDTLLEALDANERNGVVRLMDNLSAPLLAPFNGMFDRQRYMLTALIAVTVYTVVYLVLMAVLRRGRRTVY